MTVNVRVVFRDAHTQDSIAAAHTNAKQATGLEGNAEVSLEGERVALGETDFVPRARVLDVALDAKSVVAGLGYASALSDAFSTDAIGDIRIRA